MDQSSIDRLRRLLRPPSPPGCETPVAQLWQDEAVLISDTVSVDTLGNTTATLNELGAPRVMLSGHIDEIALMITDIDEHGFLSFSNMGGWDPRVLMAQRLIIQSRGTSVRGVVGTHSIGVLTLEERKTFQPLEDLWIDIGASSREEALEHVSIGDTAIVEADYQELLGGRALARGFDDRIGAFVVLEVLRALHTSKPRCALFAVATVQEELGVRGAAACAFGLAPDIGIAVDVFFATDPPRHDAARRRLGAVRLGAGPLLFRGPNTDPKLFEQLQDAAEGEGRPYQVVGYPRGTGTDANAMQISRSGVATALVGIPTRYMHTPGEMIHLGDVEHAIGILVRTLKEI